MRIPSGLAALEQGREAVEAAARVRADAEVREVSGAAGQSGEAGVATAGGCVARPQRRSVIGRDNACMVGVVMMGGRGLSIMVISIVMVDGLPLLVMSIVIRPAAGALTVVGLASCISDFRSRKCGCA